MDTKKNYTEVEGNTKDFLNARGRRHAFVWFNYTEEDLKRVKAWTVDDCNYITFGYELCPESNKPHLQGYVEWNNALTGSAALKKLLNRNTLKPCPIRGSVPEKCRLANIRYCQKEDTKDPAFPEMFFELIYKVPKQGERTDVFISLYEKIEETPDFNEIAKEFPECAFKYHTGIEKVIKAMATSQANEIVRERFVAWKPWIWQDKLIKELSFPCKPECRKIIWYCDPIGNKGKSKVCDYLHFMLDAELLENGKTADLACAWQGKPVVLFDFSRSAQERINYGMIESIKNGRSFSGKYNSCTKWALQPTHVVVFANWMPDMTQMSLDRWCIRHLSETDCELAISDADCVTADTASRAVLADAGALGASFAGAPESIKCVDSIVSNKCVETINSPVIMDKSEPLSDADYLAMERKNPESELYGPYEYNNDGFDNISDCIVNWEDIGIHLEQEYSMMDI